MIENIEQAIRVLGETYSRSEDVNEASEFLVIQGDKAVPSLIEAVNNHRQSRWHESLHLEGAIVLLSFR